MNHRQHVFGSNARFVLLSCLSAVCIALAACAKSYEWTEDVLLPDGRTVTLTRYQKMGRAHGIGETAGPSRHWLAFKNPDTGETVRWEEPGELGTVALLFSHTTPYLLVQPFYGSSFYEARCPDPPYLLLRYQDQQWQQIDLLQLPVKRLRSNVTFGMDPDDAEQIEAHDHLTTKQTQASTIDEKPWNIDLSNVTQQTFGGRNCSSLINQYLGPDEVTATNASRSM